jgi:hypothetical protein
VTNEKTRRVNGRAFDSFSGMSATSPGADQRDDVVGFFGRQNTSKPSMAVLAAGQEEFDRFHRF